MLQTAGILEVCPIKLVYPAIFNPFEGAPGYTVVAPDLPGCVTEGDSLTDAIFMAEDAASGWISGEPQDGKSAPCATPISQIHPDENCFVRLITPDMDSCASALTE